MTCSPIHTLDIRRAALALTVLLALLCLSATAAADCTQYGTGVSLTEPASIEAVLANPNAWSGKTVRVEGEIREVCPRAGCWLSLVPDTDPQSDPAPPIRIKVTDGEIVFPLSARGQRASAEGVVEVDDMTREQWASWQQHLADERQEPFDPATVGEGPYRRVQVKVVGAEVCD